MYSTLCGSVCPAYGLQIQITWRCCLPAACRGLRGTDWHFQSAATMSPTAACLQALFQPEFTQKQSFCALMYLLQFFASGPLIVCPPLQQHEILTDFINTGTRVEKIGPINSLPRANRTTVQHQRNHSSCKQIFIKSSLYSKTCNSLQMTFEICTGTSPSADLVNLKPQSHFSCLVHQHPVKLIKNSFEAACYETANTFLDDTQK